MQQQANPTIVAVSQLLTYCVTVAGIVVLAVAHVIPSETIGALAGVGLAHAGIIGYNGATKTDPQKGA